jgi:transcriptional regulator with XRE-family HTH domain
MQLGEKVGLMRTLKGLTQEDMAAKLNMSVTGYAKIERGETKLQNPRLEKIAEALGMELKDLLNFDEKFIFNISSRDKSVQCQYYISSAVELTQELEKMRVMLEAKDKEISLLNEQVSQLKEIINLMKAK